MNRYWRLGIGQETDEICCECHEEVSQCGNFTDYYELNGDVYCEECFRTVSPFAKSLTAEHAIQYGAAHTIQVTLNLNGFLVGIYDDSYIEELANNALAKDYIAYSKLYPDGAQLDIRDYTSDKEEQWCEEEVE